MTSDKKYFERELQKLGNDFYKAMEDLHEKDLIQLDYTADDSKIGSSKYKTFLSVNNSSKVTVLGRFKCDDSKHLGGRS